MRPSFGLGPFGLRSTSTRRDPNPRVLPNKTSAQEGEGGQKIAANLRKNSIYFANRGGGVKKSNKSVDVIYGSPLNGNSVCAPPRMSAAALSGTH